jgi:hypothetical protein
VVAQVAAVEHPQELVVGGVQRLLHHLTAMQKLRIVTLGISGGRSLTGPLITRRPPISLYAMVPRTEGYAYDVGVWDLSIVQGPFSVAPCQTLESRFAFFCILHLRFVELQQHRRAALQLAQLALRARLRLRGCPHLGVRSGPSRSS